MGARNLDERPDLGRGHPTVERQPLTLWVGAFNVNDMEQIQAVVEAPRSARSYTNDHVLVHLMQAAIELYAEIPVRLHPIPGHAARLPAAPQPQGRTPAAGAPPATTRARCGRRPGTSLA